MLKIVTAAVVFLFPAGALAETQTKTYDVMVIDCYDGDTCTLDFHLSADVGLGIILGSIFTRQPVRLCDIDTPEMRGGTDETKAAAVKARDTLLAWLKAAKQVKFMVPQNTKGDMKGKYGRWLGYLLADGVNLNQKLVEEGLAEPYKEKCL